MSETPCNVLGWCFRCQPIESQRGAPGLVLLGTRPRVFCEFSAMGSAMSRVASCACACEGCAVDGPGMHTLASIHGSDDSASMPELLSDSSIASSSGPDDEPQPPRQPHRRLIPGEESMLTHAKPQRLRCCYVDAIGEGGYHQARAVAEVLVAIRHLRVTDLHLRVVNILQPITPKEGRTGWV